VGEVPLGPWVRRLSFALAVVVLAVVVLTLRAVREGEAAMLESDAAFNRGDLADAVLHARQAALAYAPGAPHTVQALARLRAIGVGSESVGDRTTARLAWGAIRASALGARHVTVPYARELAEANEALARLSLPSGDLDAAARQRAVQAARKALAKVPGPTPLDSAVLLAGALLSSVGLLLVGARGITREGRVLPRGLALGLAVFTVGAACWTWAAYRA
jgi:hypothetical protein